MSEKYKELKNIPPSTERLWSAYEVSDGSTFKAMQRTNEDVSIVIEKNGKNIVDFNQFLAPGYKYIIPDGKAWNEIKNLKGGEIYRPEEMMICTQLKYINVGVFNEGKKDILGILHEAGHTHYNIDDRNRYLNINYKEVCCAFDKENEAKEWVLLRSKQEREAWFLALKNARKIRIGDNSLLKELFDSVNDVKEYINKSLKGNRELTLLLLPHSDMYSKNFNDYLETLFNKQKY
jgi:hypothetical protein